MKRLRVILTLILVFGVSYGFAGDSEAKGKHFVNDRNVAVDGYDVVAYFNQNEAVKGNKMHAATYDGVTFLFSSEANKKAFTSNPGNFLPQYGGWCAFAVGAKNVKFAPDPKTFKLLEGKLYLFYNGEHGNTSIFWNKDEASLKKKADSNWKKMSHK
ncbi:MAG: YHS domain protein [bacterium]|nr:YHS domain protein [bacterium]